VKAYETLDMWKIYDLNQSRVVGFMFMIFSLTERVRVYDMVAAHQIIQGNG